jgi:hypothetical protein
MTTREMVAAELENLTEDQLAQIRALIQEFKHEEESPVAESFMAKLRRVQKVQAPPDFSTNWEQYLSEEEDAE